MPKNLVIGCALFALLFVGIPAVQAETDTSTSTVATSTVTSTVATSTATSTSTSISKIETLIARIKELQTLLSNLKTKLGFIQSDLSKTRAELKQNLMQGVTDEDIKKVQELLASDPSIYPSGKVTGFFGPLTKDAITKFQTKHGLEVTGEINEETRAALETIIDDRKANGKYRLEVISEEKGKFEVKERIREYCESEREQSSIPCQKLKIKYKWEDGKIKIEVKDEDEEDEDEDEEDEDEDEEDEEEEGEDN